MRAPERIPGSRFERDLPLVAGTTSWARAGGLTFGPLAESLVDTLLESVGCGVLLFGPAGELWALNDRFVEIVEGEPERLRKLERFEDFVTALAERFADAEKTDARWRERFERGEAAWDELELTQPRRKNLERVARPVLDGKGRRLGWVEIYHDVTSQRMMESRLFQSQRVAALGQLLSGIAHEINNPLTSIVGYAQLLLRRPGGPNRDADARRILEEAERASRIAQNLLLFAREAKLERTLVNLNEIAERTVALRTYEQRLENIRLECSFDPHLPLILADAAQLLQVLLNLVVNAEQAILLGSDRGRIWLTTRHVSDRVALEVADDGPGVSPEIAGRIFDPFFTTKPPGVGTGLGLSILYGIVQQHGGEVTVEDRPGGGAIFRVELPVGAAAKFENPQLIPGVERPLAGVPSLLVELDRRRILVVEDEPTVARLIADVLGEDGHFVDSVLDSRDALELVRRHTYDLVICDLRMPHLDGRGFYRELVRQGSPLEHRFMFVTGDTLAPRTVDFLEESGVPYLAKPFLVEELKDAVNRALTAAAQSISVGLTMRSDGHGRRRN
jgi:signal transduction histidine kinase/ActR/RegA family two-component response regulator